MVVAEHPNLIALTATLRQALERLNQAPAQTLFVFDAVGRIVGALTDGDVRRALLRGCAIEAGIEAVMTRNFVFARQGVYESGVVQRWQSAHLRLVPLLDDKDCLVKLLEVQRLRSLLPVDALVMAGGEGQRLRPLTLHTPKPLLPVGGRPIIEYNIERLALYGIERVHVSVRYLGELLVAHLGNGSRWGTVLDYVWEQEPLGTVGALALLPTFQHAHVLVMNSDLLTNVDFEEMYLTLLNHGGDAIVATTPHQVSVPYGVLETEGSRVLSLREKPTYTYYVNTGIYIVGRHCIEWIPRGRPFNATDLLETIIARGGKVLQYPLQGYWLDIGSPEDYARAQNDIAHIRW